jgi:hypothetical protein
MLKALFYPGARITRRWRTRLPGCSRALREVAAPWGVTRSKGWCGAARRDRWGGTRTVGRATK